MNVEMFKDFLILFGFNVDEVGVKKFDVVVVGMMLKVIELGVKVEVVVFFVVVFIVKIVSSFDNFYWVFQCIGVMVEGIK